jgi:hypothetical protein
MAQLGQHFDANSVEPAAPREVIPGGKYLSQIVASEMRPTAKGGQLLWLELEVLDGPYVRRRLWDQLNLVNSNQQAVEIAQRTLSAICHAVGVLSVSDSEQLHFKPMIAIVKVRPAQGEYAARNEVGGYEAANGQRPAAHSGAAPPAGAARPAQTTQAAQPAAAPAAAPWRRNRAA